MATKIVRNDKSLQTLGKTEFKEYQSRRDGRQRNW
jgi:hypothetical protein